MNPWLLLGGSIGLEVIATNFLKLSDGFTKPLPTISALLIYALSFYLVSIVFRSLPVGLVYTVWSGVGIIFTAICLLCLWTKTRYARYVRNCPDYFRRAGD